MERISLISNSRSTRTGFFLFAKPVQNLTPAELFAHDKQLCKDKVRFGSYYPDQLLSSPR